MVHTALQRTRSAWGAARSVSGIILSGSETATGGALMVSLASSLLAFFRSPVRSVRRMVPSLTSPMCREEKAFDDDRHDDDAVRRAAPVDETRDLEAPVEEAEEADCQPDVSEDRRDLGALATEKESGAQRDDEEEVIHGKQPERTGLHEKVSDLESLRHRDTTRRDAARLWFEHAP